MRLMVFPNRCPPSKADSYVMLAMAQRPAWPEARSFLKQFPPSTCSPGQLGHDAQGLEGNQASAGDVGRSGGRCGFSLGVCEREACSPSNTGFYPPPCFLIATSYLGRGPDYEA